MNKIAVFGCGEQIYEHIDQIKSSAKLLFTGYHQFKINDFACSKTVAFTDYLNDDAEWLINNCDIVLLTNLDFSIHNIAEIASKRFKHIFIHNPINIQIQSLKKLASLARESGSKVMLNLELINNCYYNQVFKIVENPQLIDFRITGSTIPDVSFLNSFIDSFINELIVILHAVKSPVRKVHSKVLMVDQNNPGAFSIRLEFNNAAVANIFINPFLSKKTIIQNWFTKDKIIKYEIPENILSIAEINHTNMPIPMDKSAINTPKGQSFHEIKPWDKPTELAQNQLTWAMEEFVSIITHNTESLIKMDDIIRAAEIAASIQNRI